LRIAEPIRRRASNFGLTALPDDHAQRPRNLLSFGRHDGALPTRLRVGERVIRITKPGEIPIKIGSRPSENSTQQRVGAGGDCNVVNAARSAATRSRKEPWT
jgi:hypothetical protein